MSKKPTIQKTSPSKHSAIPPKAPTIPAGKEIAAAAPVAAPALSSPKASDARIDTHPRLGDPRSAECSARAEAATAPGRRGGSAAVAPAAAAALLAALRDSDADVARDAATSLGNLGDASAVEPLIKVVKNSDGYYHSIVRAAAAISLGQLRDLRAVEPLIDAVRDPIAEVCAEAIRALAALGDPRAVATLNEVIRNENGYFLPIACSTAASALAQFDRANAAAV